VISYVKKNTLVREFLHEQKYTNMRYVIFYVQFHDGKRSASLFNTYLSLLVIITLDSNPNVIRHITRDMINPFFFFFFLIQYFFLLIELILFHVENLLKLIKFGLRLAKR
jgi:hypothetical protein